MAIFVGDNGVTEDCRAKDPNHCRYHGDSGKHFTDPEEAKQYAEAVLSGEYC